MSSKKPFRYYRLDLSGLQTFTLRQWKKVRLCSVHDYGMSDGALFLLVRSTRSLEEVRNMLLKHGIPAGVSETEANRRTIRDCTVAQEFRHRR